MELYKTNSDKSPSFSSEDTMEDTLVGPKDDREVPKFVMNCNGTNSRNSSKSQRTLSQNNNKNIRKTENSSQISLIKEKKKVNHDLTQQSSKEEVSLLHLAADLDVNYAGLENLSSLNSKIDLHSIHELILNTVSSLVVFGDNTGYQLIECELLSQNDIPEAFFGVKMSLEQEDGKLSISFNNFDSVEQVNKAYNLVQENQTQLSNLMESLNRKSFFLKELKIGNQIVQLPQKEEFVSPLNMIAASFKYHDDRNDNGNDNKNNQQDSSSQQEETFM